jgi:hypothetical protein
MKHTTSLVIALLTGACMTYGYLPVSQNTATIGGRYAAEYPVPPDAPKGDVRIASFGFADLTPNGVPDDEAHALHALHLRVVVTDSGDHDWTLDTREQRIDLPLRGQSAPAFASADPNGTAPPVVTVPAGGRRVVDLFFPLPTDLQGAGQLPAFDTVWTVHTATQAVTQRTPFDRIIGPPVVTEFDYGEDYWGPPYWNNPSYAAATFVGVAPLAPVFLGAPVVIHVHGGVRRPWRR